MSKTYRAYAPDQSFLLPPSPRDWLPEEHLAYFILDVMEELKPGLRPIYAYYEREGRGYPPYHPQMMVALLLYAYCVAFPSSRKIERRTHEDVAFRVIAGGNHPDHSSIAEFRRIHFQALSGLFAQVLVLCKKAGLVRMGHVALDGTKIQGNASKHKAMSYGRMKEQEQELLKKVEALLKEAQSVDEEEDARYGKGKRGDELPEDLRRAGTRLAKIRAAKAELEAEARQAKEAEDREKQAVQEAQESELKTELPSHRVPHDKQGIPTDKAQRNFTDPESRIQKTGNGFIQGYNCQIAVDDAHQIIVAQAVTNQSPDPEHLVPLLDQVIQNAGSAPQVLSADTGYFSEANVHRAESLGTDPHIATGRSKHNQAAPQAAEPTPVEGLSVKQRMAQKLATKAGRAIYSRRKVIVEPVFGQIKQGRGFRQFLTRGTERVRSEWSLLCTTHNLLKLYRATVLA